MNSIISVLIMMVGTFIGKILGFIREMFMANNYGTSLEADAFLLAFTIPNIIFAGLSVSLLTCIIPLYTDVCENESRQRALRMINNILNISMVACTLIIFIGIANSNTIVNILAPKLQLNAKILINELLQILFPTILFYVITNIYVALLQSNETFLSTSLISVPMNIVIILFMVVYSESIGIKALAWGYLLGTSAQIIPLIFNFAKINYKYFFVFDFKDKNLRKLWILILPMFLSTSITQINTLIDRYLAGTLSRGSVSALYYANKLNLLPHTVLFMAIATVAFPELSKLSSTNQKEDFEKALNGWINILMIIVLPVTAFFIILNLPIIKLVYERGLFNTNSTTLTASALQFYALGLPAFGLREILNRAFYSVKDTNTPMKNGLFTFCFNIILNIILIKSMAHNGLALATSLSGTITILLLFKSLYKKKIIQSFNSLIFENIKILSATLIMSLASFTASKYLFPVIKANDVNYLSLFANIFFSGVIYLYCLKFLRVKDMLSIELIIKEKILLLRKETKNV